MEAAHPHPAVSDKAKLIEASLGGNLHDWLQRLRHDPRTWSWRAITRLIETKFGVEVTEVTLRSWYPDLTAKPAGGTEEVTP
jgi:hypothetical protein